MGKVLIIKGADFHENSVPTEDYVLPLTTLNGETNIVTDIHLMGNWNTEWIMKVEAIKNYPSEKNQGYPVSFGGHFDGRYRRVGLAIEKTSVSKVYAITGLAGNDEPVTIDDDFNLSDSATQFYFRRKNNIVSCYSDVRQGWVDLFTITDVTEPEPSDCYLCFGNYTPPSNQTPANFFIGTVQAKVCFGVSEISDASFDF